MPSSTLLRIRQAVQAAIEDGGFSYTVASALAGPPSTVTISALVSGATNISTARFNGAYVYISSGAAAGQSRNVRTDGYDETTGRLTVDPPWSSVPAPGVTAELTWKFPGVGQNASDDDYRTLINRGLSKLLVPDRISEPFNGTPFILLTAYAWLDRPERLLSFRESSPLSGGRPISADWRGITPIFDGGNTRLEFARVPDAIGDIEVSVLRPVHTRVNGLETTVGLVNDNDSVAVTVDDAVKAILPECYLALANRGRSGFMDKYADARKDARDSLPLYEYSGKVAAPQAAPQEVA